MIRKFMMMAVAAMVCGFTALAQTGCTNQGKNPEAPAKQDKMYRSQNPMEMAFEGILLSPEQQQKMDTLNASVKEKCQKQQAECNKDKCKNPECQAQDCQGCGKGKDGRKEGRKCCPLQCKEYRDQVKQILTPEQYTQFLENVVNIQSQHKGGKDGRGGKDQGPRDNKGPRCDKQRGQQCPQGQSCSQGGQQSN